jgi:hypothetical protein
MNKANLYIGEKTTSNWHGGAHRTDSFMRVCSAPCPRIS